MGDVVSFSKYRERTLNEQANQRVASIISTMEENASNEALLAAVEDALATVSEKMHGSMYLLTMNFSYDQILDNLEEVVTLYDRPHVEGAETDERLPAMRVRLRESALVMPNPRTPAMMDRSRDDFDKILVSHIAAAGGEKMGTAGMTVHLFAMTISGWFLTLDDTTASDIVDDNGTIRFSVRMEDAVVEFEYTFARALALDRPRQQPAVGD